MSVLTSASYMPTAEEIKKRVLDLQAMYKNPAGVRAVTGVCPSTQQRMIDKTITYCSRESLTGLGFVIKEPFGDLDAVEIYELIMEKFVTQKNAADAIGIGVNSLKRLSGGTMLTYSKTCELYEGYKRGKRVVPKLDIKCVPKVMRQAWV